MRPRRVPKEGADAVGEQDRPGRADAPAHCYASAARIGTQTPNEVIAEGLQKEYFQDYGRRASGLEVEFTGIDYIDFKF
ncbi:hypothetical protein [Streptosporangium nondiastaticum]|uniref:hypothetical protein n=1 Tax=Streptosporangium nondiastaticum TaxID=35764 RepID=UPI00167214AC|nr:hypothetical protein [Streptosporangium nondiastaticum]